MNSAVPKQARRGRDARATRAALRAAAAAAFTERGFDGSSIDEIARAAGVNKAMVSYHFGGKAGLHAAILEDDFATLAEAIAKIRASRDGATERLRQFVRAFGSLHQHNPNLSVLILREMLAGGRRLEPLVLPRFVMVLEAVAEIVAQGVREGSFRPVDPFLFHQSLVGSLVFFFAVRPFRERLIEEGKVPVATAPDAQDYIRHVESLVIQGLRPSAAEASRES